MIIFFFVTLIQCPLHSCSQHRRRQTLETFRWTIQRETVHVKTNYFAIERLAAPWPHRTRIEEHMPKEERRIKEDHQQGERYVLLLSPVDLCCVIIIILVWCNVFLKNILSSLVVFIYFLQGYSNREESRRNKEPFGMQKEGRRI